MRSFWFLLIVGGVLWSGSVTAPAQQAPTRVVVQEKAAPTTDTIIYDVYRNFKHDYCLLYPNDWKHPGFDRPTGDGRDFTSPDGRVSLRASVEPNPHNRTLAEQYATETATPALGTVLDDHALDGHRFQVEGHRGGRYFYRCVTLRPTGFVVFELEYDRCSRYRLESVIKTLTRTFPFCQQKRTT